MASSTEFVLSGDPTAAQNVVAGVLAQRGFTGAAMPNGSVKFSRGNLTKTALLGGLAGKDFHMSFLVFWGVDAAGQFATRIDRELGGSAVKGGAIGASKAANEYAALVDAIGQAATAAGVLVSSRVLA